jgi:translation initiation factor IF-2
LKIRLFALAKELGIDSKVLIQHCNDAGLTVKSSPLASITPEERDVLLKHLETVDTSAPAESPSQPMAPVREAPPDVSKPVRQIRSLGPLGGTLRARKGEESVAEEEPVEGAEVEAVAAEAEEPREPAADEPPEVAAETAPPPGEEPEGEQEPPDEEKPKVTPISRSDYVAPAGAGLSGIREMKPRASIREPEQKSKRDKKKTTSLPSVATPSFKPPSPAAKKQGPVQKPDVKLNAELLTKGNKLSDILKKHKDDTRRGAEDQEDRGRSRSLGLTEAREERRRRRQRTRDEDAEGSVITRAPKRHRRGGGPVTLKTEATVSLPITVREYSEALGRPARDLLRILMTAGHMLTINDLLDEETVLEIALELGVDVTIEREADAEDLLQERLDRPDEDFGVALVDRAPVITILGHVDHGKTTLVDRLRASNVVAGEAGGITQHIAAYQVEHDGKKLTFVDTPGHAAFGEMRARGADVTDIVVLVVAADDGVMPQTVECISHAKAAAVPIVVAMNKMDLPDVNEQKVLTELSQHDVLPSEWGGDTEVVRVSALEGTGVDDLLETLLVTAELHELQAPVEIPAEGVCIEAFRDEGLGPVVWAIVRRGTLRVGDVITCGTAHGRVRMMYTDKDEEIEKAGPATPIRIAGLDEVPEAGDRLFVMEDVEDAREIAEQRQQRGRTEALARRGGPKSLEDFFADRDGTVQELPLILKADTPGSIEALRGELDKFEHPEVKLNVIHQGVGGVNESDVTLAASSGAIIVAFHVVAEDRAELLAQREGVDIRRYNIIYRLTDDIRQALEGLLAPERIEVATGRALVLRTFSISRIGTIAGCRILNGTIERGNRMHVIRDQTVLNDYPIASLKREKDDVREVREGLECGIRLEGFNDVKEGDLLEAYRIDERKRTLDE